MNAARSISPSDLRQPTDYKARFEREQGRRQHFERRVEALELERDALKFRLQEAEAKLRCQNATGQVRQICLPLKSGPGVPSVS
jgi:hypothetical protein